MDRSTRIVELKAGVAQLEALDTWLISKMDGLLRRSAVHPGHNRIVAQLYTELAMYETEKQWLPDRIAIVQAQIDELEKEV